MDNKKHWENIYQKKEIDGGSGTASGGDTMTGSDGAVAE